MPVMRKVPPAQILHFPRGNDACTEDSDYMLGILCFNP